MDNENVWNAETGKDFVTVENHVLGHPHHVDFVNACRNVGLEPFMYDGRFCHVGPAVILPALLTVSRLGIDVPLAWDNFAKEYVVYPARSTNELDSDRIKAVQFHYECCAKSQNL